jgi:hypothetical protein
MGHCTLKGWGGYKDKNVLRQVKRSSGTSNVQLGKVSNILVRRQTFGYEENEKCKRF